MAALIGLFAGALIGHWLWQDWGAALGGIAGFFAGVRFAAWRAQPGAGRSGIAPRSPAAPMQQHVGSAQPGQDPTLARRVEELERRVATLEREANVHLDAAVPGPYPKEAAAPYPERGAATEEPKAIAPLLEAPIPTAPAPTAPAPNSGASAVHTSPPAPRANPMWAWFTGGNALTRIGVVIMFFGVAFLLKYFAEHFTVSIELRLAAVGGFAAALIGLGLRLAASRPGYGLSLQGAGAGILYLTTYAAFRLYGVLPEAPAIVLLVVVAALTIGLAVRADSQPLAALAIAGGFLAPVLVGNDGDPLLLFGYFAVLNAAILALAWSKSWRALNAVGFVFTFVLGSVWGREFYDAAHYAIVQPFLALFFVFYVGIAILNVRRAPPAARDPVDGLLVFGVPLVGFALQVALVHEYHRGAAWSAAAIAAFYAVLFVAMRKRVEPGYPLLSHAFAALAVIFATVAIPFAFDDRYTAAIWAVEAAGVYWIGVRQNARFARSFALLVEVGAGILFAISGAPGTDDLLFANAYFAGAILIAAAGLVTACIADRATNVLSAAERALVPAVLGWGVLWWLAAGSIELVRHLPRAEEPHAALVWVTASVALALASSRWLAWSRLAGAALVLLPAMAIVAYFDFELARTTLERYGWIVWPCAWIVHWRALAAVEPLRVAAIGSKYVAVDIGELLEATHAISALLLTVQIAWEASEWTGRSTAHYTAWTPCAAALPAIAFLWLVVRFRDSSRWPFPAHRRAYAVGAGMPTAALVTVWFFAVNVLSPGDASPLPYVPLANPLDVTLALALWATAAWAVRFAVIPERALFRWLAVGLFVALNGVVVRTAHHWGGVPWRLSSMLASKPLQAALTLAWTLTALAAMVVASSRRLRMLWMLGATLLALVVAKLFLVDLGSLSGLPRVIAFLGVGVLLLIIGFVSPLPPAAPEAPMLDSKPSGDTRL
ncbi:MAG: DUF2339 domain-containing protein [Casimicrobiaceae bacterium]